MIYNIIFHEKAQTDYEDSLIYYLKDSLNAGETFVNAVNGALKLISEHPKRWRNIYKNFHEINIRKYPFSIIYVIDPKALKIIIVSVYHHKRNPKEKYLK